MRFLSLTVISLLVAFLVSGIVSRPVGVEAGTAVRMDVSELTLNSELVIEAHVLSAVAVQAGVQIETEFLLEVRRTFVGEDLPYRVIRVPGGVLEDGRGMLLAGMPSIVPGEDALLFLRGEAPSGVRMPVGLAQGKFSIVQRPGGRKTLVRDSAGMTLVHPDSGALIQNSGRTVFEYADVIARIEAALASARSR